MKQICDSVKNFNVSQKKELATCELCKKPGHKIENCFLKNKSQKGNINLKNKN